MSLILAILFGILTGGAIHKSLNDIPKSNPSNYYRVGIDYPGTVKSLCQESQASFEGRLQYKEEYLQNSR